MLKNSLFFNLLIISCFVCAQNTNIRGKVEDINGNPIPYTHVFILSDSVQTHTDFDGNFQIKPSKFPCEITLSNVGYERKQVIIESSTDSLIIQLNKKITVLKEVIITNHKTKPRIIGSPKNPKGVSSYLCYNPFEQLGLVINNRNNELYRNPKWLSVSIKITRPIAGMGVKPDGTHHIRLRIYPLTNKGVLPLDLLRKDLTIAPRKGGWMKINLEHLQLDLPQEGFIVACEWLPQRLTKHGSEKSKQSHHYTNLDIRGHEISKEQKKYYSLFQYNHTHRESGGPEWIKAAHANEQRHIPCFRLEFIELN